MLVLAAVSDLQYHRLRSAVAPDFTLARAPTWDVALETIRGRPVEIAVVDPMLCGARGQEVERLRVLFPSLPLILYTPVMTPELAPVLLAMGKCGITQVVLSPTEDHPKRLHDLLSEEAMRSASYRLLDQLSPALAPLPTELRWVLQEAMRSPAAVQTIQQVAARACSRTRASRSRTSQNGSDTPRPRRCNSTRANTSASPRAKCVCR